MRAALPIAFVLLFGSHAARADGAKDRPAPENPLDGRGTIFHPQGPKAWQWRFAAGARVDILPTRVVENELRQLPMLSGNVRLGLPGRFSVDLRAAGMVVTNELLLGVAWGTHVGPVALAFENHVGGWYGTLAAQGFDATGWGTLEIPGVSIGVPLDRSRFSLKGEVIFTLGQHSKLGDAETLGRSRVQLAGTSLLLTVESFFANGTGIYYGAGILRTVPNYQAWIAFSDSRARIPYPRFVAGYEF